MKNLYQKYFENFLFERRFLYMSTGGKAKAAPGGAPAQGPSQGPAAEPPTIQDVRDKIKFIRKHSKNTQIKNRTKKTAREKRIKAIEDQLNEAENAQKNKKQKIIKETNGKLAEIFLIMGVTYVKPAAQPSRTPAAKSEAQKEKPHITSIFLIALNAQTILMQIVIILI